MKNLILFILFSNLIYSQNHYFSGAVLNCRTENKEAKRLFDAGIKLMHLNEKMDPKYLAINADIFAKAILQDTTFCDAYFFAGYILNLSGNYREAYAFHKVADMKSKEPILIYKQNLAAVTLKVDLVDEARETYKEIVKYFPGSPEGYFGIALTTPQLGDYKEGLKNINQAQKLYHTDALEQDHVFFIKGILLTLDEQYEEAHANLKKVSTKYKKDLNFNIYYSLSLLKVAIATNDEKMKKEALKYYDKIADKNSIPPNLKNLYQF